MHPLVGKAQGGSQALAQDAKFWLRDRGAGSLASRFGRLSKVCNGRCHYDAGLVGEVSAFVSVGYPGGGDSSGGSN